MTMTLYPFFDWVAHTGVGIAMRKSTFLFPAVEVAHVLGLTLLLGSVLTVDMRLLGGGIKRQPPSAVAVSISPVFWAGLALAIGTGLILFIGEPVKCFYNAAFWWKMGLLLAAVVYHLTAFRWISRVDSGSAAAQRAAAILSLSLWFGVGIAGRVIGFI
jgi:hypothetical protein